MEGRKKEPVIVHILCKYACNINNLRHDLLKIVLKKIGYYPTTVYTHSFINKDDHLRINS